MGFPFLACSSMCITGQTGSGKTQFVYRILKNLHEMYPENPPEAILYCYGIYQPLYEEMKRSIPGIMFQKGLPTMEDIDAFTGNRKHKLIILDDLMHQVVRDEEMELLFTQGTHHRCCSVYFLTQNLFVHGSRSRTIALNTTYLVLMKNVRDVSQVGTLGRQLYPGRSKILTEAYSDATSMRYGYLIVDMAAHSEDTYRLRTLVFPGEDPIVYVPKNS